MSFRFFLSDSSAFEEEIPQKRQRQHTTCGVESGKTGVLIVAGCCNFVIYIFFVMCYFNILHF